MRRKFVVVAGMCAFVSALAADAPKPNTALDVYAKPGTLIDIGNGRHLDLRCSGNGTPTVVLEAGAVADSMTWADVQPAVAKFTRVCSYDRAGYGFSDGSSATNYIDGSAKDLHALLQAAHVAKPAIFVGHSLGTNIVRSYAQAYSKDVAAIVLVDPPPQGTEGFSAARKQQAEKDDAGMFDSIAACGKAAEANKPDAMSPEFQHCLRAPNPAFSDALNAAQRGTKAKPAFWKTIDNALHAGRALDKTNIPPDERYGATPLLILQPDNPFGDAPPDDRGILDAIRINTQKAIAATSTRSEIIPVAHSSHDVQNDQPQAVVDAIKKAIAQTTTAK